MRTPRLLVAVVVSTFAAVTGCASGSTNSTGQVGLGPQPTPRTPTLSACPVTGASFADLPDLTLGCLGPGSPVRLSKLGGTPILVNLWASWCVPCQSEMPLLQAGSRTYDGKIRFVGVDTKDDVNSAKDFLAATSVHYPQLIDDDGQLLHRLGGSGLPVTVVLNAAGRIVYQRRGELHPADLQAAVRAAVGG